MEGGGKAKRPSGVEKQKCDRAPWESSASYKEANAIPQLLCKDGRGQVLGCLPADTPATFSTGGHTVPF